MRQLKFVLCIYLLLGGVNSLGAPRKQEEPATQHSMQNPSASSKVYLLKQSASLSDVVIQERLLDEGLDLERLWHDMLADHLTQNDERLLLAASDAKNDALLGEDLREKLEFGLRSIENAILAINSQSHPWRHQVAAYFTAASFWSRLQQGDETLLDRPSTPLVMHTVSESGSDFTTYTALASMAQNHPPFTKIEGERYTPPQAKPLINPSLGRAICYYLMLSSSGIGLPLLKKTWLRDSMYPQGAPGGRLAAQRPGDDNKAVVPLQAALVFPDELDDHAVLTSFLKPFDHSHASYPGQENQGAHGTCWLFAAKRLAEEQACRGLNNSSACPIRLSPYDLSRHHWTYLSEQEGGFPADAMRTAIQGGVCRHEHAPYLTAGDEDQLNAALAKFATYSLAHPDVCPWPQAWNQVAISDGHHLAISSELLEVIRSVQAGVGQALNVVLADDYRWLTYEREAPEVVGASLKETRDTLANHDQRTDQAIRDTLLGDACRAHRLSESFEGLGVKHQFFEPDTSTEARIQAAMDLHQETGHSLGIYLCAKSYLGGESCGNHAITMDGIRFNEASGTWEAHFQNSWGNNQILNGWLTIDQVFRYVYGIVAYHRDTASAFADADANKQQA